MIALTRSKSENDLDVTHWVLVCGHGRACTHVHAHERERERRGGCWRGSHAVAEEL